MSCHDENGIDLLIYHLIPHIVFHNSQKTQNLPKNSVSVMIFPLYAAFTLLFCFEFYCDSSKRWLC